MRKNNICVLLAGAALCTAAGCGARLPELTDEQSAVIAEYAAAELLKYDVNYDKKVVSDEVIQEQMSREEAFARNTEEYRQKAQAEQEEAEKEADEGGISPVVEEGAAELTAGESAEFLGIAPLSLSYQGYEVRDSYPDGTEDPYLSLDATEGMKLLVLKFLIQNNTEEDVRADLLSSGVQFKIAVNGGDYKNVLVTLLMNDLSTYNDMIPAGAAGEAVLVLQIEQAQADGIEAVSLTAKKDGESVVIALN